MSERFKFVMPGNPEHIQTIRLTIGAIASGLGFDVEEIDDIKTAVGEACQLVFCHEMEGWSKEYTLDVETEPGRIAVRVENTSQELMEKTFKKCLDCPNEGELGKLLIGALMDSVEIDCSDKNHKTISMTKTKK